MQDTALRIISELAAAPNNVFTRANATESGLGRNRVRRLLDAGVLHEPWRGVLIALPPSGRPTWLQLCTALSLTGWTPSHRSAGRILQLDGLEHVPDLEASAVRSLRRFAGVTHHRVADLAACDIVTVDGVPCTSIARTLCDLGAVVAPPTVERAFDHAIRTGANPAWLRDTAERLRRPGTAGPGVLLRLLDSFDERGTVRGSWFERLLELALVDPELDGMQRQQRISDHDGRHVATFDLAVPDARLGIEAHSREHHFGELREARDEDRDHRASVLGWDVMYLGYAATRSPATALEMVLERVRARRALLAHTE